MLTDATSCRRRPQGVRYRGCQGQGANPRGLGLAIGIPDPAEGGVGDHPGYQLDVELYAKFGFWQPGRRRQRLSPRPPTRLVNSVDSLVRLGRPYSKPRLVVSVIA